MDDDSPSASSFIFSIISGNDEDLFELGNCSPALTSCAVVFASVSSFFNKFVYLGSWFYHHHPSVPGVFTNVYILLESGLFSLRARMSRFFSFINFLKIFKVNRHSDAFN